MSIKVADTDNMLIHSIGATAAQMLLVEELLYGKSLAHLPGTNIVNGSDIYYHTIYKYYGRYYRAYNIHNIDTSKLLTQNEYHGTEMPNLKYFEEIKLSDLSSRNNRLGKIDGDSIENNDTNKKRYIIPLFNSIMYKPVYDLDNTKKPVNERRFYSCQCKDKEDNINKPSLKKAYTGRYTIEKGIYYDEDHDEIDGSEYVVYGTDNTTGSTGTGKYRIIVKNKAVPYTYEETYYETKTETSCGFWCGLATFGGVLLGGGLFSIPFGLAAHALTSSEDSTRIPHTRTVHSTKYVPTRYLVDIKTNKEQEIIADKDWQDKYNNDNKYVKESTIDPKTIYNEKDLWYDSDKYLDTIQKATIKNIIAPKIPLYTVRPNVIQHTGNTIKYTGADNETDEIDRLAGDL